jgi:hypothetical protein
MDRYEGPYTALIIALHIVLYLAIIIYRHDGPHTDLAIAFHEGLYLDFIIDRREDPPLHLL